MGQPSRPRPLGAWLTAALVVGNMIGSGVYLLPAALAEYGGISVVGFAVTSVGAIVLALLFARLGMAHPRLGGPYAYTRIAFGDFIGFQTAWGYWIAILAGNAALAVAFAGYVGVFFPAIAEYQLLAAAVALAAIWFLTWVNGLGVRQGGVVQGITTVLKIAPLVVMATLGLSAVDTTNLEPVYHSGRSNFEAITAVVALTLWAFIGLESATIPTADIENPRRYIPRATLWGTVVTAIIYILSTAAVIGVMPIASLVGSTAPFADAAGITFGQFGRTLMGIGGMVATFGALNGWILLQGQVSMAAAHDRLFPAAFARTGRSGAPVFALVISSVAMTALMIANYTKGIVGVFTFTLLLASVTTLIAYALSAAAQVVLVSRDRSLVDTRKLISHLAIAAVAFAFSMWAIVGTGPNAVFAAVMAMMGGVPVYVWMRWSQVRGPIRIKVPDSPASLVNDVQVSHQEPGDELL